MTDEQEKSGSGTGNVETVPPREILQKGLEEGAAAQKEGAVKEKASAKELDPLQKVGFRLALTFFGYIPLASVAIFFVSFRYLQIPAFPNSPSNLGDPEQYKRLLDAYKQSSDIYQQMAKVQVERATSLFQLVVASTILPVFSAILGYIFGSKKAGE